jgi:hypothetical protein
MNKEQNNATPLQVEENLTEPQALVGRNER